MKASRYCISIVVMVTAQSSFAQVKANATAAQTSAMAIAVQTGQIFGLDLIIQRLHTLQIEHGCGAATMEELTVRQTLLETLQTATLDVDGVTGDISTERDELLNLRASLQTRRDKTVAKLNAAALITGSGAGVAVSATQFNTLSGTVNNIGDGIGIGAGAASTLLSFLATRKQGGPNATVGEIPNMLAPLFDRTPVLRSYYPPPVMQYLQTVPAGASPSGGTRLERLRAQWTESGRLDPSGSDKRHHDLAALTSSADPSIKVSIEDVSNRIAMLVGVSAQVSLAKRDLAVLMRSYLTTPAPCATP